MCRPISKLGTCLLKFQLAYVAGSFLPRSSAQISTLGALGAGLCSSVGALPSCTVCSTIREAGWLLLEKLNQRMRSRPRISPNANQSRLLTVCCLWHCSKLVQCGCSRCGRCKQVCVDEPRRRDMSLNHPGLCWSLTTAD